MAVMYPKAGPVKNASYVAEPTVYYALKRQLSDDFIVIHSIPWLAQVAKEVDNRDVPTGEIDFLILHRGLGILALEVKGGKIRYQHNMAVLPNGDSFDPVAQVRRGTHGIAQWIFKASSISYRLGYGVVFPQSIVKGRSLPPSLLDMTSPTPQSICLDQQDLLTMGIHVHQLMHYWQKSLGNRPLTQEEIDLIVRLLLPDPNFTPTWTERFELNRQKYLRLTTQQSVRLQQIANNSRFVLTGRSGTGKTLLAVEHARRLAKEGKRVLFLVYNVALTAAIRKELRDLQSSKIHVCNYHELCRMAARKLGREHEMAKERQWYNKLSHQAFHDAIHQGLLSTYDALIVDEGQVFHENWLVDLESWFSSKQILVCCDETQSFAYEHKTSAEKIAEIIHAPTPFTLTMNMRSPKPVFDRLQQVITSTYEQQSQRDDEPDTLEEMVYTDPLDQLHTVIEQLHNDNIPPESIMVIHWNTPPIYRDGFDKLVGQTISVFKCRGIEAPVVIIWVNSSDPIDDITWACAYSRATSSCIAIYHPRNLLKHYNEHNFAQTLVTGDPRLSKWISRQQEKVRQQEERQKELRERQAQWPSLSWQLTTFSHQVFQWSYFWKAWYVPNQPSQIETLLWAMHIAVVSQQDVYAEGKFYGGMYESGYRYFRKFSCTNHMSKIFQSDIPISWCDICQNWTRGRITGNPFENRWYCSDCQAVATLTSEVKCEEFESSIVELALQITNEYYTAFSMALFYWNDLSLTQREFVEGHCQNIDNPINWLARIITATEILVLSPGTLIETETIHQLSWSGCPWLATQMDEAQWFEALKLGMRLWARYKAVRKKAKNVYEVLDISLIQSRV